MSRFHSLYTRYEQETAMQSASGLQWPAVYRLPVHGVPSEESPLVLRSENQMPKSMSLRQLTMLPFVTETLTVYSKAGWAYAGQWKGISFQTLLNLFSTPNLYPWVRIESFNGESYVMERNRLMNYRLVLECDGKPLTPLYGGPYWMHHFKNYIEYGIPHIKSIILLQGEHEISQPMARFGFSLDEALVAPGNYQALHLGREISVTQPGG